MRLQNSNSNSKFSQLRRGFTMIELLAVITIMVLIVGFTVPAMQKSVQRTEAQMGGAKSMLSVFEKARVESRLKNAFIWVEIERLEGQPERYRLTTWRSPDRGDGRNVDGGGFLIPTERGHTDAWYLRKVGRPKVFEKVGLDLEIMVKDYFDTREFEFNADSEAREFIVFSPRGVCFSPSLNEYNYGPNRIAPNVAPQGVGYGERTMVIPKAVSLIVTQGRGKSEVKQFLRISGSTSMATIVDKSLTEEFDF